MNRSYQIALRYAAALAVLAAAGFLLPQWAVFLLNLALSKGLVVLGLLVLWRTGLISFGQALYFCIGGYVVGMAGLYLDLHDAFVLLAFGTALSLAVAVLVGFLVARYRQIFFAMLSLAFSMILYGVLVKTEALGSTDGFNVGRPTFLGYAPEGEALAIVSYLFTLAASAAGAFTVWLYLRSTLGHLTTAIRDNEVRVEYLGVSVRGAIHAKVVLAGALAGAGGVLSALAVGHVDPEMAYWTTSGEFVFVTILAGTGNVVAPFLGSALFELLRTYAFQYTPYTWQMVLGGTLLLLILFLPDGIWSLLSRRKAALPTRREA